MNLVSAVGVEPTTPPFQTEYSDQTELHRETKIGGQPEILTRLYRVASCYVVTPSAGRNVIYKEFGYSTYHQSTSSNVLD